MRIRVQTVLYGIVEQEAEQKDTFMSLFNQLCLKIPGSKLKTKTKQIRCLIPSP